MSVLGKLHGACIYDRRIRRLSKLVAGMIPNNCSVLDVGCGDGRLARSVLDMRPDLRIEGVDVLIRDRLWLPVRRFDGNTLPHPDSSFDGVMLIDVLHHTLDPMALLREALRVGPRWLIVKDHIVNGTAAALRLRFMDYVGNSHHRVALPYNYLSMEDWDKLRSVLHLKITAEIKDLKLYPEPLDHVFGADLHFLALWERVARKNGV